MSAKSDAFVQGICRPSFGLDRFRRPVVATTPAPAIIVEPVRPAETIFLDDPERDDAFCTVSVWVRKPKLPSSQKPLLLVGPFGSGKTALLRHFGAQVGGVEAYDDQNLADFLSANGLHATRPIGLVDNIEGLDASERLQVKAALLRPSCRRLVLTAEDAFSEPAKAWSKLCLVVKMGTPSEAFAVKVLQAHWPALDASEAKRIAGLTRCNLSSAMQAASVMVHAGTSSTGSVAPNVRLDMFQDVPQMVTSMLTGRSVECTGGTGDTAFFGQLLQVNIPRVCTTIQQVSKALEDFSFLDTIQVRNELDGESLWGLVESTGRVHTKGPHRKAPSGYFEWPRSTKALDKPTMPFHTMAALLPTDAAPKARKRPRAEES